MLRLGVTGGIGSGKSFVCRLLEQDFRVPVYDCDSRAARLVVTSSDIRRGLTRLLGAAVYRPDGSLNKPLLADFLFSAPDRARLVNAVIHPEVKRDFRRWTEERTACPLVAMESAILFESGFRDTVDAVLLVDAPADVRRRRVRERDGLSAAQIEARMNSQLADDERRRLADFTVWNDGLSDLRPALSQLLHRLLAEQEAGGSSAR